MANGNANPFRADIPDSNTFHVPRMGNGSGAGAAILEQLYGVGTFANSVQRPYLGSFCDKDDHPEWARKIARWDWEDFRKNTPGTKKLFSEIYSELTRGAGGSYPNHRYALEQWAIAGGQGKKPFTRYQQFGDCVDASKTEGEEALIGWRAARPAQFGEVWKYRSTYGCYADRGSCGCGWDGPGIAAVALRTGAFFAMVHDVGGGKTYDLSDESKTESMMARQYCRSGLPSDLASYVHANHPYEDGSVTEFNGTAKDFPDIFASGGYLQTGGTNTSGSSRPFVIGHVGGHEQSIIGCDDSDDARKFFGDLGFTVPAGDSVCCFSQTWGPGFSGEVDDKYWPVGTKSDGHVVTWAELKALRSSYGEAAYQQQLFELAGTWGWGEKHEGAWLFTSSQVMRCFGGDIMCWLPRVKGFAGAPIPPPPGPPNPPGPPQPMPTEIEITANGVSWTTAPAPGRYLLFPKITP